MHVYNVVSRRRQVARIPTTSYIKSFFHTVCHIKLTWENGYIVQREIRRTLLVGLIMSFGESSFLV